MISKRAGLLLWISLATCLVTSPLFAGPTATLTGRVTDPGGGVIAWGEGGGHERGNQRRVPWRDQRGRSV